MGDIDGSKTIAVVGARLVTPYGRQVTKKLVTELVHRGFTVVSGMAIGIDTVAHWTAIAAGGKTIAVLGCGIDIIYPAVNARLYWAVAEHGAVVSEFGGGVITAKAQFSARNRIISGLSRGVVVIEGTDTSGTLITAKYAAQQGREVFAVPGPVTSPTSRASSILLKNGAKLVENADDIFEEFDNA